MLKLLRADGEKVVVRHRSGDLMTLVFEWNQGRKNFVRVYFDDAPRNFEIAREELLLREKEDDEDDRFLPGPQAP